MYSFYGGRPGAGFVLAGTFQSIAQMTESFEQGYDYSAVHYDEYVLINTVNKSDKDNGKIFRRGYDLDNGLGGAEYIGTIVGPAGPAPSIIPTAYNHTSEDKRPDYTIYTNQDSYGPYKAPGFRLLDTEITYQQIEDAISAKMAEQGATPQSVMEWVRDTYGIETFFDHYARFRDNFQTTVVSEGVFSKDNGCLVSGKTNSNISYKAATITDGNTNVSNGYVSMRIPYPVTEFEAYKILANDKRTPLIEDITSTTDITADNGEYLGPASDFPFYHKWRFNLPIVPPINITNVNWEGVGKLYDPGNADTPDQQLTDLRLKRIVFKIPFSNIMSNADYYEISGRMFVSSLHDTAIQDSENFVTTQDPTAIASYFTLNTSVIENIVLFKATKPLYKNDQTEILPYNSNLYSASAIKNERKSATSDFTFLDSFSEDAVVGKIRSLYKDSFGLHFDIYLNLASSNKEKADFAFVRFVNLTIRLYNKQTLESLYQQDSSEDPREYLQDLYQNNPALSLDIYQQIMKESGEYVPPTSPQPEPEGYDTEEPDTENTETNTNNNSEGNGTNTEENTNTEGSENTNTEGSENENTNTEGSENEEP